MRALILTCGTGGGHNSAALAVFEEMKKQNIDVKMLNPYSLKSKRLERSIDNVYIAMAKNAPDTFGSVYKIADQYRKLPFRSPVYFANRAMDGVMKKYLDENHFDIIIATHFFGADILTNMKEHEISVPNSIFIATDYVCTPFTEETKCDAYVVPGADLKEDFAKTGIPEEKIYPLGIPVKSCFSSAETGASAKRRLKLDENKNYILVAGGSMGGGKIEKTIEKITGYFAESKDIGIIIICGSNRALFEKLKEAQLRNTSIVGHTPDMASYLKASRVFVTKPGGLSSTEAAVCKVPIWHTAAIPGCETYNAEYFKNHGMSIAEDITDNTLPLLEKLILSDTLCEEMIKNQGRYINPNAAKDICTLAKSLI